MRKTLPDPPQSSYKYRARVFIYFYRNRIWTVVECVRFRERREQFHWNPTRGLCLNVVVGYTLKTCFLVKDGWLIDWFLTVALFYINSSGRWYVCATIDHPIVCSWWQANLGSSLLHNCMKVKGMQLPVSGHDWSVGMFVSFFRSCHWSVLNFPINSS